MKIFFLFFFISSFFQSTLVSAQELGRIQSISEMPTRPYERRQTEALQSSRTILELPLSIAIVEGSGWEEEELATRLAEANEIYSNHCQIQIKIEKVYQIKLKDQKDLSLGDHFRPEAFAKVIQHLPRPIIVYTKFFSFSSTATSSNGFTCSKSFSCSQGSQNLIWAFHDGKDLFKERPAFYSPNFNLEAHELAHNLGDTGHLKSIERNILSEDGFNNEIPEEMCKTFRASELLRSPK